MKLLLCMFTIWLLLWVTPRFGCPTASCIRISPAAQEKYDVPIGALYYNDIPFINEAAMETATRGVSSRAARCRKEIVEMTGGGKPF